MGEKSGNLELQRLRRTSLATVLRWERQKYEFLPELVGIHLRWAVANGRRLQLSKVAQVVEELRLKRNV